jgi:hypothetical protein
MTSPILDKKQFEQSKTPTKQAKKSRAFAGKKSGKNRKKWGNKWGN